MKLCHFADLLQKITLYKKPACHYKKVLINFLIVFSENFITWSL